jgi:L-malate glycosyltransferase
MEQSAYSLLRSLDQRGCHFRITTPRPFGLGEPILRKIDPNCSAHAYRGRFGWRSFTAFRSRVQKLAHESNYIWLTGTCASSLATIRLLPQKKILGHHFHHFEDRLSAARWFLFYQGLCRELEVITYPTDFTRNEALRIAPWLRKQSHVVRYGYDLNWKDEPERLRLRAGARKELNLPEDAFIVGNAGWLIQRKRLDVFLHTAALIGEQMRKALFVICGHGPLHADLKKLAISLGIGERVIFTGWMRHPERYYQAWDVCLFNSDFDALGRTPMEAASHGCLVAASVRRGGLSEYLQHGTNGILLATHDPQRLATEIVSLAENADRAHSFRQASASILQARYSVSEGLSFYASIFV